MKLHGYFITGTPSAVTASVSLPGGMTVSTSLTTIAVGTGYIVGTFGANINGGAPGSILTTSGQSTVNFSAYGATGFFSMNSQLGSTLFASGETVGISPTLIPIQGWQP